MADITTTLPTDPAITSIAYGSQSSSTVVNTNFTNLAAATNSLIDRSSESEDVTDELKAGLDATMAYTKVNPLLTWVSTDTVSFTADAVGVSNTGGTIVLESVSTGASAWNSGETGAASTGYNVWLICKSSGETPTLLLSAQTTLTGLTMPSGYSGGYGRRVGWVVYDAAATPTLIPFKMLTSDRIRILQDEANADCLGYTAPTADAAMDWSAFLPAGSTAAEVGCYLNVSVTSDVSAVQGRTITVYSTAGTSVGAITNMQHFLGRAYLKTPLASGFSNETYESSRTFVPVESGGFYLNLVSAFDGTSGNSSYTVRVMLCGWYDNW